AARPSKPKRISTGAAASQIRLLEFSHMVFPESAPRSGASWYLPPPQASGYDRITGEFLPVKQAS
ncbi:MAG: hypothetical protein ACYCTK_11900, partial [Acidithiobacillus ferrooxidans]